MREPGAEGGSSGGWWDADSIREQGALRGWRVSAFGLLAAGSTGTPQDTAGSLTGQGHLYLFPTEGTVRHVCPEPALLYPGLWYQCPHWPQAWVLPWGPPSNLLPLLQAPFGVCRQSPGLQVESGPTSLPALPHFLRGASPLPLLPGLPLPSPGCLLGSLPRRLLHTEGTGWGSCGAHLEAKSTRFPVGGAI